MPMFHRTKPARAPTRADAFDVRRRGMAVGARRVAILTLALRLAASGDAQLAITEVMSVASLEIPNTSMRRPDYWELTNFGAHDLPLSGYGFRDANPNRPLARAPFQNLVIRAGESVLFFQVASDSESSVTNAARFRAWWGEDRLPMDLQIRTWEEPGLSGWDGDAVWLFDAASNVVDVVQFGRARVGRAFAYGSETGVFGVPSTEGLNGALKAETAEDVGSPGFTTGAVPVRILQQPLTQSVDAGAAAAFTVLAAGMPRPRYQWYARGTAIVGGTGNSLVLTNAQPTDAGEYQVWVTNGLSGALSLGASLSINTNPMPVAIIRPPVDTTVFAGQTAEFLVECRGLPPPRYQWESNGTLLAGATNATLRLDRVDPAASGARLTVRLSNSLSATNASAWLTVERRPDLRFTEVMAVPAVQGEDNRHFDWFELTNFGTEAVDLSGWRFADEPSLSQAFTISNTLLLLPGESAVFAERLDGPLFAAWWGEESVPPHLQVWAYAGFGLAAFGEVLYLWNPAARDPYDFVASVSWARATPGVSFECERSYCDEEGRCLDDTTTESTLGERGAFRAADGGDIGSPGFVAYPPLRILSVRFGELGEVELVCRVRPGRSYRLRRAASLSTPGAWDPMDPHGATNNILTLTDPNPKPGVARFYRVEEVL